ncbi:MULTISPECIES: LysR family transcriptional regulator [Sphingobium]|jgi:DNA-binding transcriptional LysR family regulator|uniref:LysR family transcriptional regulator n=1 Tax=Sphingobium yanoikuyae TaxID=13690 RepID=A0A0J9D9C1_SPHYA|nr:MULTISPECIES: LysR family transcriptional regulator [Sphingobium]ATP16952.1 LysR family transcriptional regulator [Sphingobium yanoikuyae]KMW33006.1 LysR family transcriptional regulator [Sphingobium yanoikuyae]QHD70581.1 LysR family transcriptional regulator [Sphingobium yanoikuyae]TKV42272.1 LysR family transcriptional regulator [Sphingobium sp. MP9-4]
MDLRLLRYFVAVADEGNFNRAADRLHIAQPPLSRAIQQLEAHVGAPLLDRASRPLRLTDVGRLLHAQALQLLARMEDVETMVKTAAASQRRRLVIGFVASTIYARLPELIREFRKVADNVELVMVESTTLEQIAALKDGRIDVGFGRIRFEDPAVRRIILRNEKMVAAFPMDHPLARGEGPISIRDLAEEPQIIYPRAPRPSYADQVISLFRDHAIEPRIVHEARELQIAIGLVAAQEGMAIVPESVHRARSHDVAFRDLIEPATSPIIMSHRPGDRSPELALMASVIARQYAQWGYEVPAALTEEL